MTGCSGGPTGPTVLLDRAFTLAPGQTAVEEDTGLRILFLQVSGDSRCPADAVCITGGDALVHVRVSGGGVSSAEYELHTGDASRASLAHAGMTVTLIDLQPFPFSSRTIAQGEYRATFMVTRS
jgi:hypothetical protein